MTRKMKDSGVEWIGDIPEDWKVKTLKRAFSDRAGGAWGEEAKGDENDRICIRIADFDYSKLKIKTEIEFTKRNYNTDVIRRLELKQGDILVEKSGGGETTPVGRTILYDLPMNALYANFMDRLRVHKNNFPKFIEYVLVAFYQQGITKQYIKQTTGIQNLDLTSVLADEQIVLPQQQKQKAIADYLDNKCNKIDQTIEKEKQVIEKLKEYKQSVITEAVTKGLNPDVKMKDSGVEWIGEIPEHWKVMKVKHLCNLNGRIGWQGLTSAEYKEEGPYLITGTDFKNGLIDWNTCVHITEERYDEAKQIQIKNGDLLITKDGTIGKVAIVSTLDGKASLNGGILLIRPIKTNTYITRFMYYILLSRAFWMWFESTKTGNSTIIHLYQEKFKEFSYTLPLIEEQQEIADYLDKKCSAIDKLISNKEKVIDKLTEYKKSLIYECVTGKREVQ